jgi:hypothetical protein
MEQYNILLIFFISLCEILPKTAALKGNNEHEHEDLRSLRVSSKKTTIYYSIPDDFLINNVTGTGNKLKDAVYNSICKELKCNTDCCEGEINQLFCGSLENCKKYKDYQKTILILAIVLSVVGFLIIMFLRFMCCGNVNKSRGDRAVEFVVFLLCLIFLPFVLIFFAIKKCSG